MITTRLPSFRTVRIVLLLLCATISAAAPLQTAHAARGSDFQAGNIVNDSIFFNPNSMDVNQIQAFLNAKVPSCRANYTCLKTYAQATPDRGAEAGLCNTYYGGTKSSAQIIFDVARACGINPQVILTTLQKEQSLITDDWPEAVQYRSAMGYGCPDTAACDSTYNGFFNQVYASSRQWKLYGKNASAYNYRTGRNNTIKWNPESSCGTSQVYIYSQATAGLYNYTPYRPNQAALNNLYGTGDSCSAYGNRNFWRLYSDWFGSTTGGLELVRANSGGTTFVYYGGKKQGIPTPDVLNAWGLQNLPLVLMDDATLATIPERSTILTRLARNPYNSGIFLMADSGGTYDISDPTARNWGYDPAGASDVGQEMIVATTRLGGLSSFVTNPQASGIYMVDGGTSRQFSTSDNFLSWSENGYVNRISDSLFATLRAGDGVFSNQVSTIGGGRYVMSGGRSMALRGTVASLFPQLATTSVNDSLISSLPVGVEVSRFVKPKNGPGIYLVDNGTKHLLPSIPMLYAYAPSPQSVSVTEFIDSELNQIPTGQPISTRFAYDIADTNKQYYVSSGNYTTPSSFVTPSYGFGISQAGLSLLGPAKGQISCNQGLVQPAGSPGIYIIDGGKKRLIDSLEMLWTVKNDNGNVCVLDAEDVSVMASDQPITPFVSNGGVNYVLSQNKKYTIDASTALALNIAVYTPVSTSLLNNYVNSGPFSTAFKYNDRYALANSLGFFSTNNQTVANLWGINSTQVSVTEYLTRFFRNNGELTQLAQPSGQGGLYLVDNGNFMAIRDFNHLFNAGYRGQNVPQISPSYVNAHLSQSAWQGYIAADSVSGALYVLEGGKKHPIPANLTTTWLGSSPAITPTQLTPAYLSLFQTASPVTKSLTTGAPGIYGMNDGKKAGIPNIPTFNALYRPELQVSQQLVDSIPFGNPIPSI